MYKFARPTVGKVSRGGVVMRPVVTREGMTLTRIAVDRCVRFLSKCRLNLRLCSLGNELILFGHMHEKGRMKPIDLSQIFLSIGAAIPDRGVQVQQNGSSVWIELPDWRNSFAGARQSVRSPDPIYHSARGCQDENSSDAGRCRRILLQTVRPPLTAQEQYARLLSIRNLLNCTCMVSLKFRKFLWKTWQPR
jgi:hypothetical protein